MNRLVILCAIFFLTVSGKYVPVPQVNEGHIFGGQEADIGEYPSQVSVLVGGLHLCAGSIISENWILTAAHCTQVASPGLMSVRVGTNKWSEPGVDHEILSMYVYETFNVSDLSSQDIGLIQVTPPIVFNEVTQPIKLPAQDQQTAAESDGVIIGWGAARINGSLVFIPVDLREGFVTVRSFEECYSIFAPDILMTEAQMCADKRSGGVGVCDGDSGGPLIVDGEVVGLAVWTINGCGTEGFPAVFTRVASYRDWIKEHSGV